MSLRAYSICEQVNRFIYVNICEDGCVELELQVWRGCRSWSLAPVERWVWALPLTHPPIFSLHATSYRFWLFLRTPLTSLQACWLPLLPVVSAHGEAPLEMVSPPDSHLSKPGECSTHYFKPFLLFLLTWCMVDSLFPTCSVNGYCPGFTGLLLCARTHTALNNRHFKNNSFSTFQLSCRKRRHAKEIQLQKWLRREIFSQPPGKPVVMKVNRFCEMLANSSKDLECCVQKQPGWCCDCHVSVRSVVF